MTLLGRGDPRGGGRHGLGCCLHGSWKCPVSGFRLPPFPSPCLLSLSPLPSALTPSSSSILFRPLPRTFLSCLGRSGQSLLKRSISGRGRHAGCVPSADVPGAVVPGRAGPRSPGEGGTWAAGEGTGSTRTRRGQGVRANKRWGGWQT